jgi:hypothetical protein
MIRYSWRKIQREAGRSSKRIYLVLTSIVRTDMPRNRYDPRYRLAQKDFSGDSYLLDPYSLLLSVPTYTYKEIADYVGLASFRKYSEYLTTNDASLDILHSPLSEEQIKQNRLLSIENGRVRFKYEEATN